MSLATYLSHCWSSFKKGKDPVFNPGIDILKSYCQQVVMPGTSVVRCLRMQPATMLLIGSGAAHSWQVHLVSGYLDVASRHSSALQTCHFDLACFNALGSYPELTLHIHCLEVLFTAQLIFTVHRFLAHTFSFMQI